MRAMQGETVRERAWTSDSRNLLAEADRNEFPLTIGENACREPQEFSTRGRKKLKAISDKAIHRIAGLFVFVISAIQFFLTAQPSVSFWDPGEIAAASYLLQVPHPPGAPLWLLIGRLFSMVPFSASLGFRINCLSVLSSAFAVLFLYLSAAKLLKRTSANAPQGFIQRLGVPIAAAIGALSLSFCDTFWFNGVESNVFALSTFIFAFLFWLALLWLENPGGPQTAKYLLLIAYLTGLSVGVHLMSVLVIAAAAFLVVIILYVKNDEECKKSGLVLLGHIAVMAIAGALLLGGQRPAHPPSLEEYNAFDRQFVLTIGVISIIWVLIFRKRVFTRDSIYFPLLLGAIALAVCYPGIVKYLPKLLVAIAGDNNMAGLAVLGAIFACGGGVIYWANRTRRPLVQLLTSAFLLAIVGYTVYTTIVIRANQDPPMNEDSPKTFSGLITYVSREQYGDWPVFMRRFSQEAHQQGIYEKYSSDLDFLLRYQMDHMFNRFLLWNYVGRVSTDQDAGIDFRQLFGIPFLVGLVGIYFQFRRDWKLAAALLLLFILMGYVTAFYQNQQEPQPRERDYFYVGAFFVFSAWIALGILSIFALIAEKVRNPHVSRWLTVGAMMAATVSIPGRMLQANYYTHDRSRNWVPWDYAYNILQTCEKDAILFTNGDNDTFPLWFLQDVEGFRRDVRVVNLSLGNTPWYIQEMKNKPYYHDALAVPISMSDRQIANVNLVAWEPRVIPLPVPREAYARYGVTDTAEIRSGRIEWRMNNSLQFGQTKAIRVQDILTLDIVRTNAWKRPIYFAATCAPDSRIGLDGYLWFHGLAWRLEPRKTPKGAVGIDQAVMEANLMHEPAVPSRTLQSGYLFRGLADSSVFLDENACRLTINYRQAFVQLAMFYADENNDRQAGLAVMERMEQIMPQWRFPLGWELESDLMFFYQRLGATARFEKMAPEVESECLEIIAGGRVNVNTYHNPYRVLLELYALQRDYRKSVDLLTKLDRLFPNTPELQQRLREAQEALSRGS